MQRRFEGLDDRQWNVLEPLIPNPPYTFGRPHPDRRRIVNTIIYVLITGCRWCDVPIGPQWGKRSTAHKYLGLWQEDGTWNNIKQTLLEIADLHFAIDWSRGSVDGAFSPWKGRGR